MEAVSHSEPAANHSPANTSHAVICAMDKISTVIPPTILHAFEKLSDGFLTSDIPEVERNRPARLHQAVYGINAVEKMFEGFRAGLIARKRTSTDNLEDKTFYAVARLKEYLDSDVPSVGKIDETTGSIFVSYLYGQYKHIKELAKEFDEEER